MKNFFLMDCRAVLDTFFTADKKNGPSPVTQFRTGLHLLFCPVCAEQVRRLKQIETIMRTDFMPPSPDLEEVLMRRLYEEDGPEETAGLPVEVPAGFSFRGWVIIGFFVLLSLASSFFGINFTKIADSEGLSFLLPVGLTVGMVVTCYGALFIGSHLKDLSSRFRLR